MALLYFVDQQFFFWDKKYFIFFSESECVIAKISNRIPTITVQLFAHCSENILNVN